MNTAKLRSKRVILPTIAAVAVLGIGGVVWASTAASATTSQGSERDRVAAAATQAVGGGKVVKAESSDDAGEAYEVEVRLDDGTEVDVTLDKNLDVIARTTTTTAATTDGTDDVDDRDARRRRDDVNDADDRNDTRTPTTAS